MGKKNNMWRAGAACMRLNAVLYQASLEETQSLYKVRRYLALGYAT
jgi:hypothetical protein